MTFTASRVRKGGQAVRGRSPWPRNFMALRTAASSVSHLSIFGGLGGGRCRITMKLGPLLTCSVARTSVPARIKGSVLPSPSPMGFPDARNLRLALKPMGQMNCLLW